MYPLISISGKMASGKSTVAKALTDRYNYSTISISADIKRIAACLVTGGKKGIYLSLEPTLGTSAGPVANLITEMYDRDFGQSDTSRWMDTATGGYKKTDDFRKLLQNVADLVRHETNDDGIWVHIMMKRYSDTLLTSARTICDDVRMPAEKDTLENFYRFKTIRLDIDHEIQKERLFALYGKISDEQINHVTETALDNAKFDLRIDNSNVSEQTLTSTVVAFLNSFTKSSATILSQVVQLAKDIPLGKRDNWEEYFMSIAYNASLRSSCGSRRVGALLIDGLEEGKRHIIATGYNGNPGGAKHCIDGGCPRFVAKQQGLIHSGDSFNDEEYPCHAFHAEHNVINQILDSSNKATGGILFTTTFPCINCARLIHGAKIKTIYYCEGYPDKLSEEYLEQFGIKTIKLDVGF